MDIYTVLKHYYGYDHFKKGQEELINQILDGQDVLGILPTGAGKSICYQIPALLFNGITIVISPLISLMKDQVDTLCEMGIKAAYLNSSLSNSEVLDVLKSAKNGEYKLLYVAPERLETDSFIELIKSVEVSLIAVDEAHCISQWGHDFRPSYTRVSPIIKLLKSRPIVAAFTATATSLVKEDIIKNLELKNPFVLTTGFDRENLFFEVKKPKNKGEELYNYLKKYEHESGIIYCSTRKTVESVFDYLKEKGYSVTKYHAGLAETERTENQDDFIYDRKQIMIATNAFGMGIDKSNIRYVIHYNMPKNMESYYQEAGRAGRDGEEANCVLLFSSQDIITNKFLIENSGDGSNNELEYQKLNDMIAYCNTDSCLRKFILNYFGQTDPALDCHKCGNCKNEMEKVDITLETKKILSCVKRMNERFGTNQVVDVLVGANTEKIRTFHFDELSTYGIMKENSKDYIKEIISFLIAEGYLVSSGNQYPILTLSNKSYSVLKDQEKVYIKRLIENKQDPKESSSLDPKLFELLRQLRKDLAEKQKVPPFVIFSDTSLHDMCKKYPTTHSGFLKITGVGESKLTKYGELFINCIKQYVEENNIEIMVEEEHADYTLPKVKSDIQPSKMISYELYKNGNTIDAVAKLRGMSKVTIENHLLECFMEGLPFELLIDDDVEKKIIEVCHEVGTSLLKPIKELLPEQVSYMEIRYVIIKNNLKN